MNTLSLVVTILTSLLLPYGSQADGTKAIVKGQQPDLPWGDINLLVITDDHSWVTGHGRKQPSLDADYGDVLSFYQHLKAHCDATGQDLFFVMNGDWIDGTGLSLDGETNHLVPLIQKMPFDIVNTGNHELYKSDVIDHMLQPGGFIDWWGTRHLASNIVITATNQPLSNRYTILEGKNSRVLVFGFIYHLQNPASEVVVLNPEEVVKEQWFPKVLRENAYDAILVMAHMGIDDEAIDAILYGIRGIVGNTVPVQFVAGHTHKRRHTQVDDLSKAVEAGRYLDTIGFISFPTASTVHMADNNASAMDLFQHVFLDANTQLLKTILNNGESFTTSDGQELHDFISTTESKLGLNRIIGCSPNNYFINRTLEEKDSLWRLYRDFVVPTQLDKDKDTNRAIILSQGSWRYDLFAGENAEGDAIAISPFNESMFNIGTMPCEMILSLYDMLNNNTVDNFYETLPAYILSGRVVSGEQCELYTHHFELKAIQNGLEILEPDDERAVEMIKLTSTSIWTSFIQEEWPCGGNKWAHPPWSDDHKVSHERSETEGKKLPIAISLSVVCMLILAGIVFARLRSSSYATEDFSHMPRDEEMNRCRDDFDVDAEVV